MRLPSSRVRRVIYNVGGGAAVVITWLNPSPGVAAVALVMLAALFLLAMLAGPVEPVSALPTNEYHACMDDALEWDDETQSYDWVCPHSET